MHQSRHSRLDDIKFRALKQHVRTGLAENINFSLQNTPIYGERTTISEFISPAIRNLSILGGGMGAVKGLMEPANDEMGQPVSINQRLGNTALNAIGGGLAGAGLGMGYGALKPGVSSNTSKIAQAVSNIPDAIDGNVPLLKKIQNVAQSDIPAQAAQPSALARTFDSTIKRGKRDLARTRRFFTGKGAGIETTQIPLGKSFTTTDPVTGAVSRQFVPDVDRTGNVVTRAVENLNPNAQLDDVAAVDRIAGSIAGGSAGAVAGLGGGIAGAAGGAGIGGVLGGLAGTSLLPGLGTAGGAVLGAKAGAAMGGMAGAVTPAIIGGVTGAQKGVRGTYDAFKDRGARDIGKLKELADSSGLSNRAAQARTWMGFEYESQAYPYRKISTFAAPSYYKTGALLGGGLGTGLGVVNGVSSTINRQQDREEQELNDIAAIDNPYIRQGTYQEYTSPEQRSLRALRNGADITGRGALGALTGGGLGVGLGGLAGASIDQNTPAKKSILERIYGR